MTAGYLGALRFYQTPRQAAAFSTNMVPSASHHPQASCAPPRSQISTGQP
ncbi:hypothetical protein JMJ77_0010854, partial [Colletotrichum scovillei]